MNQKVAIVTGASSGFGAVITKQLEQEGYYIYAMARRMELLEKLSSENVEAVKLDVTSTDEVNQAIEKIISAKGRIDLLVNNAGYGYYSTIEEAKIEDVQYQFDVNFFGIMRLTQAVLPHMRRQLYGMIINLSSVVGLIATPVTGYYSATKHAVEAFSDALRMETSQYGIKTVLIEPGIIKTEFDSTALSTLQNSHDNPAYDDMVDTSAKAIAKAYAKAPKASIMARTIHRIVNSRFTFKRYPVGWDAMGLIIIKRFFGDWLLDFLIKKQMTPGKKRQ